MMKTLNHQYVAASGKVWLTMLTIALACTRYELRGQQSTTGSIEGRVIVDSIGIGWNGELSATMGQESRVTPMVRGQFSFDNLTPGVWHVALPSTKYYRAASRDVVVAAGQHVIVEIAAHQQPWWVALAENYDSPQSAVANTIGARAIDCGQFGPDVQDAELASAIACATDATRDGRPFFVIRHYLVPGGTTFKDKHVWLAEGLLGHGDEVMRHFEYRGSSIHEMRSILGSVPKPGVSETTCATPRVALDATGTVRFECSNEPR